MKALFALCGWLLWNVGVFSLDKNDNDEKHTDFPLWQYVKEKYDNWIGSAICCGFLLLTMKLGFGVDVLKTINVANLVWSDALIGFSGPAWEILLWGIKKVRTQFK